MQKVWWDFWRREFFVDKKTQVKSEILDVSENSNKFKSYSCFYCATTIANQDHMKRHFVECHGLHKHTFQVSKSQDRNKIKIRYEDQQPETKASSISSKYSFPIGFPPPSFPPTLDYKIPGLGSPLSKCELCGWYARTGKDMMNHKKNVHNYLETPFKGWACQKNLWIYL